MTASRPTGADGVAGTQGNRGKLRRPDRLGLAAVALGFLWWIPVRLLGEAVRDVAIIWAAWPETPWRGAAVLVLAGGGGIYLALRLATTRAGKVGAAAVWVVLTPVAIRLLLTGSTGGFLGLGPPRYGAWLIAGAALAPVALAAWCWGRRVVLPATILYGVAMGAGSVFLLHRGAISIGDLGLYRQALWSTLHGYGFMHVSGEGGSHFAVHNSPALLALLPLYWLWPAGELLLLLQTAAVAACLPLAYRVLAPHAGERMAVVGAAGFCLLSGVVAPALDKFHEVSFALPLMLGAVLALREGRGRRFGVCVAGLLLLRETFAPMAVVLGGGCGLGGRRRWGAYAAAAGVGWLLLSYLVVMPAFTTPSARVPYEQLYGHLGRTPSAMVRAAVRRPGVILGQLGKPANQLWAEEVGSPVGGPLGLLAWPGWLGAGEALTVAGSRTGTTWPVRNCFCQYAATIHAGMWLGLVAVLAAGRRRWGWSSRVLTVALLASFLVAAAQTLPWVGKTVRAIPPEQVRARAAVLALLPPAAPVAVPYDMLPLVSERPTVFYNAGDQPATQYLVSLAGQDYQRPQPGRYRELGRYGPYTLWKATGGAR